MEELQNDPIIKFYLKMSKSTETETELPIFSETMLRLAIKHFFGKLRPFEANELILYRKLLLFHYAQYYTSVDELNKIMTCFDVSELLKCIDEFDETLEEYNAFAKDHLIQLLYKDAYFEILSEWANRYFQLHDEVNKYMLRQQAITLQFFMDSGKFVRSWMKTFENMMQNRHFVKDPDSNVVQEDLELKKIVHDIQDKLNPLVVGRIIELADNFNGAYLEAPVRKRRRLRKEITTVLREVEITLNELNDEENTEEHQIIDNNNTAAVAAGEECDDYDEEMEFVELIEADYEDDEEENSNNTHDKNDEQNDDAADESTMKTTNEEELSSKSTIIDYDTALSYLAALQAYAVENEHFESISLLDRIDSDFRK